MKLKWLVAALAGLLCLPAAAFAQTGTIIGKVTASDGSLLPGVTVEARSPVLPGPRVTVTDSRGEYRLPALPPGDYTLTFTLSGMQTVNRPAAVQLGAETFLDAAMDVKGVEEVITVVASGLVNREAGTIQSGVTNEQFSKVPVGQEFRDLIKLIPGIQYSVDGTRGPSAGGNGQDNVYLFDGVNVTLPLFGTLSAEPATHDIAQMTATKGGARAVNFDRSGGFTVDSVSKSGTSRFSGLLGIQFQTDKMAAAVNTTTLSRYELDRTWFDANLGGPIVPDRVYFFTSYYRPQNNRENRSNAYSNDLPDYVSVRNEGFGKVTLTPVSGALVSFSYRQSHRFEESDLFGSTSATSTGTGNESWLDIGTLDGSWVINQRSFLTFKYTSFTNETQGRPDNVSPAEISTDVGTRLDLQNLDQMGLLNVPAIIAGQTAYNTFIQPLIDRFGYVDAATGVLRGGGTVGFGSTFDRDDFFRKAGQVGFNITFGSTMTHELHVGYQRYTDSENLTRESNGWGSITVPGGRTSFQGTPIFYAAAFQQQGFKGIPPTIHSEYQSQSFEINDNIRWNRWSFNVGILASEDTLYGQGLAADSSRAFGLRASPGTRYEMYKVPFSKMIQPRIGGTFAYNGRDTVFLSYAKYNPAASSLPRAASWDRNLATTIQAYFDANGVLFATDPVASSSGKLFVEDMTPRQINEVLFGTARQVTPRLTGRVYGRIRRASHFWEDTNNTARLSAADGGFEPPPGIPRELYIPDLQARRLDISNTPGVASGSTYVIAELDGAFTRYRELTAEAEWRGDNTFFRASYTWSRYFGNFDQDSTTTTNDANIFIGSSFIADGAGRQLWNNRTGTLRGDRPHALKLYGYRSLPWNATLGTFIVAQSGQPWESWNYEIYRPLTGTSTSDTSRFGEAAGSRRSETHYQIDFNYTQTIRLMNRLTVQIVGDLFNIFNNATGFNIQPSVHSAAFGIARSFFDPRRFQMKVKLTF
jgi:hypothetical protein